MLQPFFLAVEIRDGGATLQAALVTDRAAFEKQRFQQEGLTSPGRTHQRNIPDALCRIPHGQRSRHAQTAAHTDNTHRLLLPGGTCIASWWCGTHRPEEIRWE